jgi:TAT (twin-arginine translocation) pathway-exported protein
VGGKLSGSINGNTLTIAVANLTKSPVTADRDIMPVGVVTLNRQRRSAIAGSAPSADRRPIDLPDMNRRDFLQGAAAGAATRALARNLRAAQPARHGLAPVLGQVGKRHDEAVKRPAAG